MRRLIQSIAGLAAVLVAGAALAALFDRGGSMIYGTSLNLMWLER